MRPVASSIHVRGPPAFPTVYLDKAVRKVVVPVVVVAVLVVRTLGLSIGSSASSTCKSYLRAKHGRLGAHLRLPDQHQEMIG